MKGLDSASYHYPSCYFEGTIKNLLLEYLSCLKGASQTVGPLKCFCISQPNYQKQTHCLVLYPAVLGLL